MKLKFVFMAFCIILVTACNGGDSSSDNSASSITIDDVSLTFSSTEITAGDSVELTYDLGGENITATLSWDDGHIIELKGSGVIRHGYDFASTYVIKILIDSVEYQVQEVIVSRPISKAVSIESATGNNSSNNSVATYYRFATNNSSSLTRVCLSAGGGGRISFDIQKFPGATNIGILTLDNTAVGRIEMKLDYIAQPTASVNNQPLCTNGNTGTLSAGLLNISYIVSGLDITFTIN